MVRAFLLVYWLASEALLLLKIYTLARLISLLQFRSSMERGLQLQGLIRGRKVVHLLKHPDGWSEGMFTRRCIREGQPSDIYSIKYDDGTAFDQPCVRTTYGTGLGTRWCIIH
jgi:hypothetical protein